MTESEKASNAEALVGKNAMSGFLALMNSSETDINKLRGAIENCDGASESMAETMQDNLNGQLTILKSQLEELAISFGDILMPTIRKIVSAVQQFVDKLNSMDEGTRETIIKIGLLAASIGPLLIVLGKTISTVGTAMRGFSCFLLFSAISMILLKKLCQFCVTGVKSSAFCINIWHLQFI